MSDEEEIIITREEVHQAAISGCIIIKLANFMEWVYQPEKRPDIVMSSQQFSELYEGKTKIAFDDIAKDFAISILMNMKLDKYTHFGNIAVETSPKDGGIHVRVTLDLGKVKTE